MPPPGGGGGQQEADNSLAPLWITVGLFVLCGFLWYFFKTYIVAFILTIRLYEADLVGMFVPAGWTEHLNNIKEFILTAKQGGWVGVNFTDLMDISNAVGSFIRYPIMIILMGLGLIIYLSNPLSRYKRTHSMKTLLDAEMNNWPQVIPVSKLDLVNTDIDKGPWAMAVQPMDFAKAHKLIVFDPPKNRSRFASKIQPTATIDRDEARKVFAMQLGRYWTNVEALPIHARALFAVFAARVPGDRDSAWKLLEQIARSAEQGKPNFSGADALLQKHKANKLVTKLTQRHAYEHGVLASMLELARQDGVLAVADFIWLKPIDRKLWYMLNSVGRQTPFPEVSGSFAHWIAEKEFGRRLNVPMVEEAVNGLEDAIKNIVYKPEEE